MTISLKDIARLRYTVRAYRKSPHLCAEHLTTCARPILGELLHGGPDVWATYVLLDRLDDLIRHSPANVQRSLRDSRKLALSGLADVIATIWEDATREGEEEGYRDTCTVKELDASILRALSTPGVGR